MFKKLFLNPSERVLALYRLSEKLYQRGSFSRKLCWLIRMHLKVKYAIEFNNINPIGANLKIYHFNGIVIGHGCDIGSDLTLYNQVTIGGKRSNGVTKYPVIGNRVTIYPGARIIGPVEIGDDAVIGPNVVVYKNVSPGATVVCKALEKI